MMQPFEPATMAVAVAALFLAAWGAEPARAQTSSDEPSQAVEFYRSGRDHFDAGRYREAIADLERAFALDPTSPTLVYNLARVYELLGELDQSIEKYREYLVMLPARGEEDERQRVAETIRRLEGARDQVEAEMGQPATPPETGSGFELNAPVLVEERGVADWLFWGTAISGVALLAGGIVTGVLALEEEATAQAFVVGSDGPLWLRDCIADTADSIALAADILFIASGVAGVASVLLYVLRTRMVETHPGYDEPTALVSTDGHGLVVGVRGAL